MFTDIGAAIEEARWARTKNSRDYAVVQIGCGLMKVSQNRSLGVSSKLRVMFSTKDDGNGTVSTGVR
ncbi:UNVERIFIED_ORG: hypothetical protein EC838_2765 [Providencia alcalifaciens]